MPKLHLTLTSEAGTLDGLVYVAEGHSLPMGWEEVMTQAITAASEALRISGLTSATVTRSQSNVTVTVQAEQSITASGLSSGSDLMRLKPWSEIKSKGSGQWINSEKSETPTAQSSRS